MTSLHKECTKCNMEKSILEFYVNKRTGKFVSSCNVCVRQYQLEWRRAKGVREWEALQAERRALADLTEKECVKCGQVKTADQFHWRVKGKTRVRACKKCQAATDAKKYADRVGRPVREQVHGRSEEERRERINAWARDRRARRTPEEVEADRARRSGRKRDASPEANRAKLGRRRQRRRVEMTVEDRELSTAYRRAIAVDPCFYCGGRSEQMHDDHKLPLAKGGTDHWWNLVRACAVCNLSKGAKTAEEFLTERAV